MIIMDSFLKKFDTAILDSLLAVGIVFCVLIFISFIISLFQNIAKAQNSIARKKVYQLTEKTIVQESANATISQIVVKEPEPPVAPEREADLTDDLELVAVLSAAIAAYTEMPTEDFVVRSIKKITRNNYQQG